MDRTGVKVVKLVKSFGVSAWITKIQFSVKPIRGMGGFDGFWRLSVLTQRE
jgi:hypothetical protein